MKHTLLLNRESQVVAPEIGSFQAAAANADWAKAPGFGVVLTDQPGEKSWPITGASFILLRKTAEKPESARQALDFFGWAYRRGGGIAAAIDYVPMPDPVVGLIEATWETVKQPDGRPVWHGS